MAVDGYSSCSIPTLVAPGKGIDPAPLHLDLTLACDTMNESLQSPTPPSSSPECLAGTELSTVPTHFLSVDAGDAAPTDLLPQVDGDRCSHLSRVSQQLFPGELAPPLEENLVNANVDLNVVIVRLEVANSAPVHPQTSTLEPTESDVTSARVIMPLLCGSGSDADTTELDLVSCTCSVQRQSEHSRSPANSCNSWTRMSSDDAACVGPCVVRHHEATGQQQQGDIKDPTTMGTDYANLTLPPAPFKSALKKTGFPSRGHSVCFNEACNTFLECDYVIYVDDDDDDDEEYQIYCPILQQQQHNQQNQQQGTNRAPQLVSVTSFNLQFPESCTFKDPPVEFVDQVTLSPPDGYKDGGAAFETLVDDYGSESSADNETRSNEDNTPVESPYPATVLDEDPAVSGIGNETAHVDTHSNICSTQGQPATLAPALEEVEEAMQERSSSPLQDHEDGGVVDHYQTQSGVGAEKVTSFSDPEPEIPEEPQASNSSMLATVEEQNRGGEDEEGDFGTRGTMGLGIQPKHGILKGGKTWRGVGEVRTGVRFVDDPNTDVDEDDGVVGPGRTAVNNGEDSKNGHTKGSDDESAAGARKSESGPGSSGTRSNSAFQQLFPRARKLLQHYPENSSSASANSSSTGVKEIPTYRTIMLTEAEIAQKYEGRRRVREAMDLSRNETDEKEMGLATPTPNRRPEDNRARSPVNAYDSQYLTRGGGKGGDSLVERLRWLTDLSDDHEETTGPSTLAEHQEKDAPSQQQQGGGWAGNQCEVQSHLDRSSEPQTLSQETDQRPQGFPQVLDVPVIQMTSPPAQDTNANPGSRSSNTSTYKKLNELFFKSKKEKSKDKTANSQLPTQVMQDPRQWKINKGLLNRSLSPPPPSEVETKLRPIRKHHVVHILPKKAGSESQGEFLGRLPNVVPRTDQIYHSQRQNGVLPLQPQLEQHQQQRRPQPPPVPVRGHLLRVPEDRKDASSIDSQSSGADSYSLEDIEAVLSGDPSGVNTSCVMHMARALLAEELRHEDVGGSRSSGSSGDSGLGSHDNSMMNGELELMAESDELVQFVRQGLDRIERMRQRYNGADDETEDYGFLRRPSVRGIKPRFSTTSEILQQMQAQLQPPTSASRTHTGSHATWPYPQDEQSNPAAVTSSATTPTATASAVDPREKRRSMLPVLQEETSATAYFNIPHQEAQRPHAGAIYGPRHASVLQVYASTGDLFQHVGTANSQQNPRPAFKGSKEAPGALLLRQHHNNPLRTQTLDRFPSQQQQQQQQQSVNPSCYGTTRRAPPAGEPYQWVELVDPTSYYAPNLSPTKGHQEPQHPMHPHYNAHHQHPAQQHYPLKLSSSTPALIQTAYQHPHHQSHPNPHPHRGLCPMNSNPAQTVRTGAPGQETNGARLQYNPNCEPPQIYPCSQGTYPRYPPMITRQVPYGMVSPVDPNRNYPAGAATGTQAAQLPPPIPSRVPSMPQPAETSTAPNFYDAKVLYANTTLGKGEREAPEGASSSPGLSTDTAYPRDTTDMSAPPCRPTY